MTKYQFHVLEWADCMRCSLCETRKTVVLGRGQLPCDVLFVGEAPGESEDVIGRPFVGPAGLLFDRIIRGASKGLYTSPGNRGWDELRFAWTNTVACIPRNPDVGGKADVPDIISIRKCKPRLEEFIALAAPRLIVAVGKTANDWLIQGKKESVKLPNRNVKIVHLTHPAAILKANEASRGLMSQTCVVTLRQALAELDDAGN